MNIHQLSVTYLREQDRVLVRVNTVEREEMRLWLTRRLMMGLWPLLSKLLAEHLLKLEAGSTSLGNGDEELKKMLAEFRREEFLQHADFDTPYQEEQDKMPLGEEPLLVTDVDLSPLPNGRLQLAFNERPPGMENPRSFQIELDPKVSQGLVHLLEQALTQSQWREPFESLGAALMQETGGDESTPPKPRYLN